ncbi:putative signaling protein [Lachnospiraceae bacterium]|nr:putative signaling protein [Lachnospiraceae bacterium]
MVNKITILVVDDITINRVLLKNFWGHEENYEIIEARTGEAALEILNERKDIDLILLDVIMPGMSGIELLARLKKLDAFMHIPVIVNTQSDEHGYEEEALRLGADDFIYKPYIKGIVKKRVENVLKKSAYDRERTDELTGIYTLAAFYSQTKKMLDMDPETEYAILQINIVKFKVINELFGVIMGDEILVRLAQMLKQAVGTEGTYGRMEADHFVCCIPISKMAKPSEFSAIMEEGTAELENKYGLTIHGGIYIARDRTLPVAAMCDRAVMACRNTNNNMVKRYSYYDEEEGERYLKEQLLIRDMKKALAEGQFYVEMQPIFDTKTKMPVSAEALVRWMHPEKGFISPGVFIPLFERSGLISRLDAYVWEEVCRVLARFKKEGVPLCPVSVNASRVDFCESDLLYRINTLTEKYGLEKKLLKVEVTESAYTQNPQEIIKQVVDLRREGYDVLMDDFGSGYSSLNTLRELPVNILKIDMKFMNQLEDSRRAASIVLCIVKMAKMLGMKTVAEGVETKNQVEFLRNIGCDSIQGYFFSRPIKPEELQKMLKTYYENAGDEKEEDKVGILVVDDQRMARMTLKDALGKEYRYFEAANGEQALEILHENAFAIDLVITDVVMPRMDGITLLQEIKANPVFMGIPVVVVTASEGSADEFHALEMGATELIRKPFDFHVVKRRIKNVLKIAENEWLKEEVWNMKQNEAIRQ